MENNVNTKVSILVPVYGVEKYIGRCARSLFEQDYQHIEYVFVNDCTRDKSIEILLETLQSYPWRVSQVKIVDHEVNRGLAAARNTALDHATGGYVLPVDSDDYLSARDAVSRLMEKALEEDDDAVFYDMQILRFSPPRVGKGSESCIPLNSIHLTTAVLRRECGISIWGCLYRRSLFVDNGIRSIEGIAMGEDYAIKPMLTYYMKRIGHLPCPFYVYRQTSSTSHSNNFKLSYIDDLRACIDGFYRFFRQRPDYREYEEAIKIGEILSKEQCIRWWYDQDGSREVFERINRLFPYVDFAKTYLKSSRYRRYRLAAQDKMWMLKTMLYLRDLRRTILRREK